MASIRAIILHRQDNVATVIEDGKSGDDVAPRSFDGQVLVAPVRLQEDIAFGHKVALFHINRGDAIVKYGEVIGQATTSIEPGAHVHVHNVEGRRLQEARDVPFDHTTKLAPPSR